jgi:hypothetical protein
MSGDACLVVEPTKGCLELSGLSPSTFGESSAAECIRSLKMSTSLSLWSTLRQWGGHHWRRVDHRDSDVDIFNDRMHSAALLSPNVLETALSGLHDKAGVPTHSRVTMNNVNITTNIIAKKRPDVDIFNDRMHSAALLSPNVLGDRQPAMAPGVTDILERVRRSVESARVSVTPGAIAGCLSPSTFGESSELSEDGGVQRSGGHHWRRVDHRDSDVDIFNDRMHSAALLSPNEASWNVYGVL